MRGGKREGAGRPKVPKEKSTALPNHTIRCTKEEYQQIKEHLKQLREKR